MWAFIKNISMGGCYVAMATPLPVKAKLRIALWLDDETKIWADGIVISSHPASGMGIKFLALSRKNLDALEQFLKLSSDPGVPSSTSEIEQVLFFCFGAAIHRPTVLFDIASWIKSPCSRTWQSSSRSGHRFAAAGLDSVLQLNRARVL